MKTVLIYVNTSKEVGVDGKANDPEDGNDS